MKICSSGGSHAAKVHQLEVMRCQLSFVASYLNLKASTLPPPPPPRTPLKRLLLTFTMLQEHLSLLSVCIYDRSVLTVRLASACEINFCSFCFSTFYFVHLVW